MGRYLPNPRFDESILGGLPVRNLTDDGAKRVAGAVRAGAPAKSGAYRRSIGYRAVREDGRWVGRVYSSDPFWHLIEFGSTNNPAYAALRRGLERVVRRTRRIGKGGE